MNNTLEQEITKELLILDILANNSQPDKIYTVKGMPQHKLYDIVMTAKDQWKNELIDNKRYYSNDVYIMIIKMTSGIDKTGFVITRIHDLEKESFRAYSMQKSNNNLSIQVAQINNNNIISLYKKQITPNTF